MFRQREHAAQRRRQARAASRHASRPSEACAPSSKSRKLHIPASPAAQDWAASLSVAPHSPGTLRPNQSAAERARTIGASVRGQRARRHAAIEPERKPAGTWARGGGAQALADGDAVTLLLHCRYIAVTLPLHYRYKALADGDSGSEQTGAEATKARKACGHLLQARAAVGVGVPAAVAVAERDRHVHAPCAPRASAQAGRHRMRPALLRHAQLRQRPRTALASSAVPRTHRRAAVAVLAGGKPARRGGAGRSPLVRPAAVPA